MGIIGNILPYWILRTQGSSKESNCILGFGYRHGAVSIPNIVHPQIAT